MWCVCTPEKSNVSEEMLSAFGLTFGTPHPRLLVFFLQKFPGTVTFNRALHTTRIEPNAVAIRPARFSKSITVELQRSPPT